MPSSALTSPELTTIRGTPYRGKPYLSIVQPVSYATGRINQSVFTGPIISLTVDGVSADWTSARAGQTVTIGTSAGGRDILVARLRATPTSTTLPLMEFSPGDPGLLAVLNTAALADNAYVTIWQDYNVWSVFPYIAYSGGVATYYKDNNLTYSTQNETAIPAALNMGPNKCGWVDSGTGLLSHTFSPSVVPFDSATVSSRAWYIDGVASGTGATLAHDYAYGCHVVRLDVTLSNGAVVSGVRFVHAHDPVNYPPLEIKVSNDRRARQGRGLSFELVQAFDTDLLTGALAMMWEDTDQGVGSATTMAVGFIEQIGGRSAIEIANKTPYLQRRVNLTLASPLQHLQRMAAFSQLLQYAANPGNWTEAIASLMHFNFFPFYCLYWHSTLLMLVDFNSDADLNAYVMSSWAIAAGDMVSQFNTRGADVRAEVCENSYGHLYIRRKPSLMSASDRAGLVTRYTLTDDDVSALEFQMDIYNRYHQADVLAFTATTGISDNLRVVAAGKSGGQGAETLSVNGQIVIDLAEHEELAPNFLADANNPIPRATIRLSHGYDVLEPAERYLIDCGGISASKWPTGRVEFTLAMVEEVSIQWTGNGGRKISLTVIPLTSGSATPGEQAEILGDDYPVPSFDADGLMLGALDLGDFGITPLDPLWGASLESSIPVERTPTDKGVPGAGSLTGNLVAWTDSDAGKTANPNVSSPAYSAFRAPAGEALRDYKQDTATPNGLYELTDAKLRYNDDPLGAGTWSVKQTTSRYNLLRHAPGVAGGNTICLYSPSDYGSWSKTFDFTVSDQGFIAATGEATYVPGTGWQDIDASPVSRLILERAFDHNIVGIETIDLNFSHTGISSGAAAIGVSFFVGATQTFNDLYNNNTYNAAGSYDHALTPNADADHIYTQFQLSTTAVVLTYTSVVLAGTGWNPFGTTKFAFSTDNGTSLTEVDVADYKGDEGMDTDDFGLEIGLCAASRGVYFCVGYGNAFSAVTGLSFLTGDNRVTCVRVPYRKQSGALNNAAASLECWITTDDGETYLCSLNTGTGAATIFNRAITISATTYAVIGQQGLVTSGADSRYVLALCQPVAGGNTALVYSQDGGSHWSLVDNNADYTYVDYVRDSTSRALLAGADGIALFNVALFDRDGDFASAVDTFPALGALLLA